jgi:Protein of unknown function (DUF3761)
MTVTPSSRQGSRYGAAMTWRVGKRFVCALTVIMAASLVAGCGAAAPNPTAAEPNPTASVSSATTSVPSQSTPSSLTTSDSNVAVTAVPAVANKTGAINVNAAGAVLPNSARTPGATNPSVTQASIGRTICVTGWTSTIRPSSSVTTALKVAQLASRYAYKGDTTTGDYEEDHLISLELGGAPSAEANLWPEPYGSPEGARVKDVVENKLHTLVCGGTITLATAQRAIARNWWIAYQTYVGTTPAASTYKAPVVAQPAPAPASVAPGGGATALCKDGTYSYAAHHQGACSRHGGVRVFYK